ncbi:Rv1476 family membrane protein [Millisia brevis]|uniref:Rv1476 family membrane protein n=1 Tax=Millisia brevis TaxID=264148 RepID=UPI000A47BBA3|nr:DUF6676 family protein [Millisia brevis]
MAPIHLPTSIPVGVDPDAIAAELRLDHVSADHAIEPGLLAVVDRARESGIDLNIVVLDRDPVHDSQLRDLATDLGDHVGGTVLVLSPGQNGSYSDVISRVTLEAGQDVTYTGNPVVSANNFLDTLLQPGPPWTAMTISLLLLVAVVLGVLYWVNARRDAGRTAPVVPGSAGSSAPSADGVEPRGDVG